MKFNVTTVLLVAVVGFVGWTLYTRLSAPKPLTGSGTTGTTSGESVAKSVADALGAIAGTIGIIAKTAPSTNGGNTGTV